ncbi:DNA-binding domain-containing protein [Algirhabdus cladophorae]|uniref:HvfC/BufC N-terminal domain-containing protein n=1 Tax=Algirhabdus cladophorae TaxID=3377108 RepID=UPI003B84705B
MTQQSDFKTALLDPDRVPPPNVVDPQGRAAPKRFNVYRNNVAVSLTDALRTGFPVILKLVGDDFFNAMAGVYLRQHPPASSLMMHYGQEMPQFLKHFKPAEQLPYLADVAQLELVMRASYHAADMTPIAADLLQTTPTDTLMQMRFCVVPSAKLIRSRFPIYDIWRVNMTQDATPPQPGGQAVLITRPDYDPMPHLLPAGAATFVLALQDGATFGDALQKAGTAVPEFDLAASLGLLLQGNALAPFST